MLGGLGLDYPSSSDDEQQSTPKRRKVSPSPAGSKPSSPRVSQPPLARKARKLPSLPSTFDSASAAHNNPSAHQGRTRSRPFVDGDYYAHVYAELDVSPSLRLAIDAALLEASTSSPTEVHALLPADGKLHVSLSHPLPLRRDAIKTFAPAVAATLSRTGGFALSLAGAPVVYYNTLGGPSQATGRGKPSPGARAFLGLRVGAGARELAALLGKLEGVLEKMHLPQYHAQPEFHASFGWALCPPVERERDAERDGGEAEEGENGDKETEEAATPFADDLVARLARHTDSALATHPGWRVSALCVKVAKVVTRITL